MLPGWWLQSAAVMSSMAACSDWTDLLTVFPVAAATLWARLTMKRRYSVTSWGVAYGEEGDAVAQVLQSVLFQLLGGVVMAVVPLGFGGDDLVESSLSPCCWRAST